MKSGFLIDQLISSIENLDINQIDRLKIVKVLLSIKIKLIEFSDKDIKVANNGLTPKDPAKAGPTGQAKRGNGRNHNKPSKKHNLIIQFIENKGGRVNAAELLSLGLAGRSLRRYIKDLCQENKIKIEKLGRNYFYLVI